MVTKKGQLVAQMDAGEAGGPGIEIGSLVLEGVELGPVKIPAGLTAELRRSQGKKGIVVLEDDAGIGDVKAEVKDGEPIHESDVPEIDDINAAADELEALIDEQPNRLGEHRKEQLGRVIAWLDVMVRAMNDASKNC